MCEIGFGGAFCRDLPPLLGQDALEQRLKVLIPALCVHRLPPVIVTTGASLPAAAAAALASNLPQRAFQLAADEARLGNAGRHLIGRVVSAVGGQCWKIPEEGL